MGQKEKPPFKREWVVFLFVVKDPIIVIFIIVFVFLYLLNLIVLNLDTRYLDARRIDEMIKIMNISG